MTLFSALLFFVLTPGIVLSLPPKGSKVIVALTHAVVFALVYSLTHKAVYAFLYEGFATKKKAPVKPSGTITQTKAQIEAAAAAKKAKK